MAHDAHAATKSKAIVVPQPAYGGETLRNTMANEVIVAEQTTGTGVVTRLPVPILSFWMHRADEVHAYRDLKFDLVHMPLPPELAAMLRQPVQPLFIDTATAAWLHGRASATMDWQLPPAPGQPPRLVLVVTTTARMPRQRMRAMGGAGIGRVMTNVPWAEYIAAFQETKRIAPSSSSSPPPPMTE